MTIKHFNFYQSSLTECGITINDNVDSTHKDMRLVDCEHCRKSPAYLETLRIWDAAYQTGYHDGFWDGWDKHINSDRDER